MKVSTYQRLLCKKYFSHLTPLIVNDRTSRMWSTWITLLTTGIRLSRREFCNVSRGLKRLKQISSTVICQDPIKGPFSQFSCVYRSVWPPLSPFGGVQEQRYAALCAVYALLWAQLNWPLTWSFDWACSDARLTNMCLNSFQERAKGVKWISWLDHVMNDDLFNDIDCLNTRKT